MTPPALRTFPLPIQFRQKVPSGPDFFRVTGALKDSRLKTVCEEAKCPNRTECYARGTLTFQILGDVCTRRCGFCAEATGRPAPPDPDEPEKLLEAAKKLGLRHAVITAPARDDVPDGGAAAFARCVRILKDGIPGISVEVLTSDLLGREESLRTVLESRPDVFNHNLETVRRLTPRVRGRATYNGSVRVLRFAAGTAGTVRIKSGIMVGLGETWTEIEEALADLRSAGVSCLTAGQYLRPSTEHLPIEKFYSREDFARVRSIAESLGFEKVFAGALVRSSYRAGEMIGHV